MFKLSYYKFILDNVYQILSESTGFCGRYDKNILMCFCGRYDKNILMCFSVHSVVLLLFLFIRLINGRDSNPGNISVR